MVIMTMKRPFCGSRQVHVDNKWQVQVLIDTRTKRTSIYISHSSKKYNGRPSLLQAEDLRGGHEKHLTHFFLLSPKIKLHFLHTYTQDTKTCLLPCPKITCMHIHAHLHTFLYSLATTFCCGQLLGTYR